MFLAAGCGAYGAAIFHVGTHAFFKALLFLGSGAVIMAMHHEQDTDKMGGLRKWLPVTHGVFLVARARDRRLPAVLGFLLEGRDPALGVRGAPDPRPSVALGDRPRHRRDHRLLHVAAPLPDFLWRMPRRSRNPAVTSTKWAGWCSGRSSCSRRSRSAPASSGCRRSTATGSACPTRTRSRTSCTACCRIRSTRSRTRPSSVSPGSRSAPRRSARSSRPGCTCGVPRVPARIRAALGGVARLVENKYYVDELYDALIVHPLVAVSDKLLFRVVDAGLIDGARSERHRARRPRSRGPRAQVRPVGSHAGLPHHHGRGHARDRGVDAALMRRPGARA